MRTFAFIFVLGLALSASAQTLPSASGSDLPSLLSDVPSVPGIGARLRGFDAGVTLTSVHDSSAGWYTLLTPAGSYTFSRHYSLDLSMPVYLYRLAEVETTITEPPPAPGQPQQQKTTTTTLQPRTWDPGDLVIAAHATFGYRQILYTFTPSMTLPSGDANTGLSTGRVTFDFDNHFQMPLLTGVNGLLNIGAGDSSNLVNRLVTRDYTSLGPLAHFQLGFQVPLFLPLLAHAGSFQTVAYEQLPLGDQKLYTTLTRPGYPDLTVVSGRSVSEDNGFTNSLFLPLTRHLTLQGYYNRSLRLHIDTAAVGLSWALRGSPTKKRSNKLWGNPRPDPSLLPF